MHTLPGGTFALATGRLRDRDRAGQLVHVAQPDIDIAVEGGVVTDYGENEAWSRRRSLPVDISGLVAMSEALYGLELLEPPTPEPTPPPPPQAELVARTDIEPSDVNLATAHF